LPPFALEAGWPTIVTLVVTVLAMGAAIFIVALCWCKAEPRAYEPVAVVVDS